MALTGWLLIYLLGFILMNAVSMRFSLLEKIGFSFPAGMGITTLLMFIADLIGLPLNQQFNLLALVIMTIVALFFSQPKMMRDIRLFFSLNYFEKPDRKQFHPAWYLLIACLVVLSTLIIVKGEYWIVFLYDSVAGYDFLGRAIAFEGTIHNSLFDPKNPVYSVRDLYPPLIPLAFAFAYSMQNSTSQIVITLFFVSTVLSFYALLLRFTTHFAAALFTFLLITAPQLTSFFSLSSSSIPFMYYTSMGLLCLFIWYRQNDLSCFYLGSLLILLALWTRSESLAPALAGGMLVLEKSARTKTFVHAVIFFVACLAPFVTWQLYLSSVLHIGSAQPVITYLFFDTGKLSRMLRQIGEFVFAVDLYGIIPWIFVASVLINFRAVFKRNGSVELLMLVFSSWIFITWIFYQIDVDYRTSDSLGYLTSGYVRAMFYLLPLMLFYTATTPTMTLWFQRINEWQNGERSAK